MTANGVLVANKPRGMTSHDVVRDARRLFSTRSVGHAGTLDPMASGVLVLLVGEGTKLAPFLTLADKEYEATVRFGRGTDTLDAEGKTVSEISLEDGWLDEADLSRALGAESARTVQVPPAFSAISVGGVRAHRLARRGEPVSLEPRPVQVSQLELVGRTGPVELRFRLRVSKGYYVRSFARDLGARLGVPAHLCELVRTASGPFVIGRAAAWPPAVRPELLSVSDAARLSLPTATLTAAGARKSALGQRLGPDDFVLPPTGADPTAWYNPGGQIVAIGLSEGAGTFRVRRGFHSKGTSDQNH